MNYICESCFGGASQFTFTFSASIHLFPTLLLALSFSLFSPSSLSYLIGISLYLQLNMFHRAQGEAWHSLWTVQSISERAFLIFCFYMPANNNTSLYRQCKGIQPIHRNKQGAINCGTGPRFIIRWIINSILWIASQCPHPGTIDDIQPTWLNPISKGDGWSWAHLPCNHIIAVWVNQTWIKRFVCCSWQTEKWKVETMPHAEIGCHQLEITAGIFFGICSTHYVPLKKIY